MTEREREIILGNAQEVFFAALRDGYCGNKENTIKGSTPRGTKTLTFVSGNFMVVDEYQTSPHSDFSAGTTTIFYCDIRNNWFPVWWMAYGGEYPKEVILFLKETLSQNYQTNIFFGGRGPAHYRSEKSGLVYENLCAGDFNRFQGMEEIWDIEHRRIGFHKFFGMAMI